MTDMTLALIGIVVFLVLLMLGMNIGFSLLLVGFVGTVIYFGGNILPALGVLQTVPATQASDYALMVIPLFVMMGNFAYISGLGEGLFDMCNKWLSRFPGSLACGAMAASAGFAVICGSCAATAATMGTIALPEMKKYGYSDSLATGAVAMGGALGVLIPPSTIFIIYGIVAEASIGRLFASGIVPAVILVILCIATVITLVKLKPSSAPAPFSTPWADRFKSLINLIPIVVLFGVVLGGMFSGFFTVNQSAAIGAIVACLISVVRRKLTWTSFKMVMFTTVKTTAMIFLIMIGAKIFCQFLLYTGFPTALADIIGGLDVSKYVIILIMTVIYLILGAIMDELPMILMTVPIFLPIVLDLGFNAIWFGVYVVLVMEMGTIAPPVGLICFVLAGVAPEIPLFTIYKGALPYLITIFICIAIVTFFPALATWLPDQIYGPEMLSTLQMEALEKG